MSLGKNMLADFRPRASSTAATLIAGTVQQERIKEVTLQLRIEEDTLLLFKEICQKRCPNKRGAMSSALRNYIKNAIATDGEILNFDK